MLALEYTRRAVKDLNEIWNYIRRDDLRAANGLVDDISDSVTALRSFPMIGTPYGSRRRQLYHHFVRGYAVFYEYDDEMLTVARILHCARDFEKALKQK